MQTHKEETSPYHCNKAKLLALAVVLGVGRKCNIVVHVDRSFANNSHLNFSVVTIKLSTGDHQDPKTPQENGPQDKSVHEVIPLLGQTNADNNEVK